MENRKYNINFHNELHMVKFFIAIINYTNRSYSKIYKFIGQYVGNTQNRKIIQQLNEHMT